MAAKSQANREPLQIAQGSRQLVRGLEVTQGDRRTGANQKACQSGALTGDTDNGGLQPRQIRYAHHLNRSAQSKRQQTGDGRSDPKSQCNLNFIMPQLLKMMVQGRHPKDAPAFSILDPGVLEVGHL